MYNNVKNTNIYYILFKLNCGYYPCLLFEKDINLDFKSRLTKQIIGNLRNLIIICQKNPLCTQEFQKQACDNRIKLRNYPSGKKIWLNSKNIKIQYKPKLKTKFFRPFQVLHLIEKQAYKLKLFKK